MSVKKKRINRRVEPEVHTNHYVLRLENGSGQAGYFTSLLNGKPQIPEGAGWSGATISHTKGR